MTVDEAIERMKSKSILMNSKQAKEDWLTIAEYLEELKDLRKWKEQEEKACDRFYQQGRADVIKDTELFREIFLEDLIQQSIGREEALMYRNICVMAWSKYLKQLKEQKND